MVISVFILPCTYMCMYMYICVWANTRISCRNVHAQMIATDTPEKELLTMKRSKPTPTFTKKTGVKANKCQDASKRRSRDLQRPISLRINTVEEPILDDSEKLIINDSEDDFEKFDPEKKRSSLRSRRRRLCVSRIHNQQEGEESLFHWQGVENQGQWSGLWNQFPKTKCKNAWKICSAKCPKDRGGGGRGCTKRQ